MGSNGSDPTSASQPLIGLSTYVERARFGVWDQTAALVPYTYVAAIERAGGCALLLPPAPLGAEAVVAEAELSVLDGFVVTGGPDVNPELYGGTPHARTDRPSPVRDAWEVALCRCALDRGMPLLAICRGLQILNVSLGGTLHQHLPDIVGTDVHRSVPGQMSRNRVVLKEGSLVSSVLGPETESSCHHHQAVDRLAEGLAAVGFAEDGTLEAAEFRGNDFAVAVQWHPEDNPEDGRLFAALVEAAARHRARLNPAPLPARTDLGQS